ncbi:MAG TPA: NIPSNAP family protein [Chthoniobacteraceae bacterium]|jgi:hypothetical protein|nr:NIPSNAP family protein [Chthoniobacteraceae bacterium]
MFSLSQITRALLLALSALLVSSAMVSAADTRCFEVRVYTAAPGKLEALHARFRDHTLALFEKHGITNIGYWTPSPNPDNKLAYILAYPSKEAREESWKKFQADPDWVKAKNESELGGKLVAAVEQRFLQATDFSPEVKPAKGAAGRAFEIQSFEATPGNLEKLVKISAKYAPDLFKAHGIEFLGAWTPLPDTKGGENRLTYLLAYPNEGAIETAAKALAEDPKLAAIGEELEKEAGGAPITEGGTFKTRLVPTDYSPMK